jgi:sulfatase maturation enzyme AslB (radical SAM superfamily)
MSRETLETAVDRVMASPFLRVSIHFYGGEPLLELESLRAAVARAESLRRPGQDLVLSLATNGTLLERSVLDYLIDHGFHLRLSLDGLPVLQDERAPGTFDALDALLDDIRERHPDWYHSHLEIATTLLPRSVPHLAETVEYFLRNDVADIRTGPCITPAPGWDEDWLEPLRGQMGRVVPRLRDHYRRTGRVPFGPLFPDRPPRERPRSEIPMCGVGRSGRIAVDVDGRVVRCVALAGSYQHFSPAMLRDRTAPLSLGSIGAPELEERSARLHEATAREELFSRKEEKYSSYGACRDCVYLSRCRFCPVAIGHLPNNDDPRRVPDFVCAFNLAALEHSDLLAREIGTLTRPSPLPLPIPVLTVVEKDPESPEGEP